MRKLQSLFFILALLFCLGGASSAETTGRQQLTGHRTRTMEKAPLVSRHLSTDQLHLAISLPVRNRTNLDDFVKRVSDPKDSLYRHYMTVQQFTEAYGPTGEDYEALRQFARAHGLIIEHEYANQMVLDVSGQTADIEKAFHVHINDYQRPDGTHFFAPDQEPSVDLDTPLEHLSGITNEVLPRPKSFPPVQAASVTHAHRDFQPHGGGGGGGGGPGGSGKNGNFFGTDYRSAYAPGVSLTGSGQTLGLVEYDVYWPGDVTDYVNAYNTEYGANLNVPLNNIYCDSSLNASTTPSCVYPRGEGEVVLDIEMVISMAPGLNGVNVYMGGTTVDVFERIVSDNTCKEVSSSWGWQPVQPTENNLLAEMAAQGQSYFNGSGDGSSNSPYAGEFTTDPPYGTGGGCDNDDEVDQTLVGSTDLYMVGGVWSSETCVGGISFPSWSTGGILAPGSYAGSFIPSYQVSVPMTTNYGSTTYRNVPDVSIIGDNVVAYECQYAPNVQYASGTSCSAPLWAAFIALVNEQAVQNSLNPVGFINPAVYQIGLNPTKYAADFHDITVGSNGSSTQFPAVTGYDLATGWGSPKGQNLINDLSGVTVATATTTLTPSMTATLTATKTATLTSTSTATQTSSMTGTTTFTNTVTNTPTMTSSSTGTSTASHTATLTETSTVTNTPTITDTSTITSTATLTDTLTSTSTATNTPTLTVTSTLSNTPTTTDTSTITSTATLTDTLTSTDSPTETSTATNTATLTETSTVTNTPTITDTPTITSTATLTDTLTSTDTATNTATLTETSTGTNTATLTDTPTITNTFTVTNTLTQTSTPTNSPTSSYSPTVTATATSTLTNTRTSTTTATATLTPTTTAVYTNTPSGTATSTGTSSPTPITNPACAGYPVWSPGNVAYGIGQKVSYNNDLYECLENHVSSSTTTPLTSPALWKDLGPCGTTPTLTVAATPVIYPNPASGPDFHLRLAPSSQVRVDIFTVASRHVRVITQDLAGGTDMNISLKDNWGYDLANGLYFLRITAAGKTTIAKLLVTR